MGLGVVEVIDLDWEGTVPLVLVKTWGLVPLQPFLFKEVCGRTYYDEVNEKSYWFVRASTKCPLKLYAFCDFLLLLLLTFPLLFQNPMRH